MQNKASIVAFPTLSSSLNQLPGASNLQSLPLHPSMYAQRAAESEAKLQKAFQSKSGSSQNSQSAVYTMPPSSPPNDTLMMKSRK